MTETYVIDSCGKATIIKDPDETLDYPFDWAEYLAPISDVIDSASFEVVGLTLDSQSNTTTTATAIVSGGVAGVTGVLTSTITTAQGRIVQRSIYIKIRER